MSEFSREVRAAFAGQQTELGILGDTPRRLLRQGLETRRRPPVLRVAGAVAALLAIAAVAGVLMLTRQHPRVTSPATPRPIASPTWRAQQNPLTAPLNVPDNVPVILFRDPDNRNQVDGITWDGKTAGRVTVLPPNASMRANPAGTRFVSGDSVFDRSGNVVAKLSAFGKGHLPVWTDDGQRLCDMSGTDLLLIDNGNTTRVAGFPALPSDQTSISVVACSTKTDKAVVQVTGSIGSTLEYWVVQMSTGQVLNHKTLPVDSEVYAVASPDANVIAEGTAVYDAGGKHLATMTAPVVGLSADGSIAVLDGSQGAGAAQVLAPRSTELLRPGTHIQTVFANPDDPRQVAMAESATGSAAGSDGYPAPAELVIYLGSSNEIRGWIVRS